MELPVAPWPGVLESDVPSPIIDMRSPGEFAEDHAPTAISCPLLDDEQRAIVGTLYNHEGPQQAFARAERFIEARLPALVERIRELGLGPTPNMEALRRSFQEICAAAREGRFQTGLQTRPYGPAEAAADRAAGRPPIYVTCWRGGMRSASFALLLGQLGWRGVQLARGIRGYRAWIMDQLGGAMPIPPMVLLQGFTGAGKTLLLRQIAAHNPGRILDLEGLAGHRSSILGDVGLEPVSQKAFETALVARLRRPSEAPIIVEAESRKVGSIILPERLWQAMEAAPQVWLETAPALRAQRLAAEYARPEQREQLRERLTYFLDHGAKNLGPKVLADFDAGRHVEVAHALLERYYDPRYRHSIGDREMAARIDGADLAIAEGALMEAVAGLSGHSAAD